MTMNIWLFFSADASMASAYQSSVTGKDITDSPTCKTAYAAYNCIMIASAMNSAPCDASGAPMLPCHELCTAYVQACKVGGGISTLPPFSFPLCFQRLLSVSLCSESTSKLRTTRIVLLHHEIKHGQGKITICLYKPDGLADLENKQPA